MAGFKAVRFASHFLFLSLFALFAANAFAAGTVKNYDQRISHLERLMQNQNLLEMLRQLQSLQREVSDLRGEMELLNHNQSEIKKQQKDLYLDLDQRIQDLDQRLNSGTAAVAAPVVPPPVADADATSAQEALSEQEGYQSAFAVLKAKKYEEAIEAFQIYLITYPASDYADNAQYWMAEAYYVLKDYQSAISHFNKVINAYPDSRKVPDAYLKLGFSFYELKDWQNARQALDTVVTKYATSTAARLAERRLKKMKQDGHL